MLKQVFILGGMLLLLPGVGFCEEDEWHSKMYKHEHTELNTKLNDIEAALITLPKKDPSQQVIMMKEIVKELKENWVEHSKWEETVLYPAIDGYASCQDYAFTSTQRQEHIIILRWINELQALSDKGASKAQDFMVKGIELIGLLHAHRESEEKILLPIFNKHFPPKETPEQEKNLTGIRSKTT